MKLEQSRQVLLAYVDTGAIPAASEKEIPPIPDAFETSFPSLMCPNTSGDHGGFKMAPMTLLRQVSRSSMRPDEKSLTSWNN